MPNPSIRLREARERAGYSSGTAAAEAFGWPASTYLGHENGSRGLRKNSAERYARAFGVSWSWLMGGKDESASPVISSSIPVAGLIDPGAFRKAPPATGPIPELRMEVPGFEHEGLRAWELARSKDHHFLITAPAGYLEGTTALRPGDEVIFRREAAGRFETAAWRLDRGEATGELVWSTAYAAPSEVEREGWILIDQPEVELLGIVVAEFKLRSRVQPPEET